jgi:surfactin synthase thioesterase subunit
MDAVVIPRTSRWFGRSTRPPHARARLGFEVLRDVSELRPLLRILRSDMEWTHTYRYRAEACLHTTITAVAGTQDRESTAATMAGWRLHGIRFAMLTVPGGHFFLRTAARHLTSLLADDLLEAAP